MQATYWSTVVLQERILKPQGEHIELGCFTSDTSWLINTLAVYSGRAAFKNLQVVASQVGPHVLQMHRFLRPDIVQSRTLHMVVSVLDKYAGALKEERRREGLQSCDRRGYLDRPDRRAVPLLPGMLCHHFTAIGEFARSPGTRRGRTRQEPACRGSGLPRDPCRLGRTGSQACRLREQRRLGVDPERVKELIS